MNDYLTLNGSDLICAVRGAQGRAEIWFYRTTGACRPTLETPTQEFIEGVSCARSVRVYQSHVRQVRVDGVQAWGNPDCVVIERDVPVHDQRYVGRGSVELDIRTHVDGWVELVQRLVTSGCFGGSSERDLVYPRPKR